MYVIWNGKHSLGASGDSSLELILPLVFHSFQLLIAHLVFHTFQLPSVIYVVVHYLGRFIMKRSWWKQ